MNFNSFISSDLFKLLIVIGIIAAYIKLSNRPTEETSTPIKEKLENVSVYTSFGNGKDQYLAAPAAPESSSTELTVKDLLPNYESDDMSKVTATTNLQDMNFLLSGFSQGIDTIGSSKKIVYNDIRSGIPIPKDDTISPWGLSSYDTPAGFYRRKLE